MILLGISVLHWHHTDPGIESCLKHMFRAVFIVSSCLSAHPTGSLAKHIHKLNPRFKDRNLPPLQKSWNFCYQLLLFCLVSPIINSCALPINCLSFTPGCQLWWSQSLGLSRLFWSVTSQLHKSMCGLLVSKSFYWLDVLEGFHRQDPVL